MGRPVKDIAVMIEEQDAKGLSALPGIGAATAERIIAEESAAEDVEICVVSGQG